ncbi:MAG: hypothetical protein M3Y54_04065 [Bacteroidota bacterium]|nr:hypothetical protein [Bacteroidota bacterium]
MLRITLLFLLILGLCSAETQAAPAAWPIHRHRPIAGDFRPVYRRYRGPGRHKDQFRKLFRPRAPHRSGHAHKARPHRGTL